MGVTRKSYFKTKQNAETTAKNRKAENYEKES